MPVCATHLQSGSDHHEAAIRASGRALTSAAARRHNAAQCSWVLKKAEDVPVYIGEARYQSATTDVTWLLHHGATRGSYLCQLCLDVRNVPYVTGDVIPCGPPPGTSPMCCPAASKPT